jgi:hypothetical protein
MRTLFDKIAQRFWTHAVRPGGVSPRSGRINPALSANLTLWRSEILGLD